MRRQSHSQKLSLPEPAGRSLELGKWRQGLGAQSVAENRFGTLCATRFAGENVLSKFRLEEKTRMRTKYWVMLAALALVLAPGTSAFAQLNSTAAAVNLNAVMSESLSLSAAPGTVNFTPLNSNGVTNGDSAITINTAWVVQTARTNVHVYAYFSSTTALTNTSSSTYTIPVSSVQGSVNGGAASAFTGNSPFATGSSLSVASVNITGTNKNSSESDSLALKVDTTGAALPAGTYTGVLYVQAQAI
jgi:hypothetical protein